MDEDLCVKRCTAGGGFRTRPAARSFYPARGARGRTCTPIKERRLGRERFEYETAREAGDELSAHFHNCDWADEVLHTQIGRRWLKREGLTVAEALDRARDIHERT